MAKTILQTVYEVFLYTNTLLVKFLVASLWEFENCNSNSNLFHPKMICPIPMRSRVRILSGENNLHMQVENTSEVQADEALTTIEEKLEFHKLHSLQNTTFRVRVIIRV